MLGPPPCAMSSKGEYSLAEKGNASQSNISLKEGVLYSDRRSLRSIGPPKGGHRAKLTRARPFKRRSPHKKGGGAHKWLHKEISCLREGTFLSPCAHTAKNTRSDLACPREDVRRRGHQFLGSDLVSLVRPLERGGNVVHREEDGHHESADTQTKKDDHRRLNHSDDGLDGSIHFTFVEFGERVENARKLSRLLTNFDHLHHDTRDESRVFAHCLRKRDAGAHVLCDT